MTHEFRMYVGPMFGGKTTRMLAQLDRYEYMGYDTLLFKPSIDERYSKADVVTHSGKAKTAYRVINGRSIERWVAAVNGSDPCIVAVDEAFMIPGVGESLKALFLRGHTILVSSLQLSAKFEALEEIQTMFPFATHIEVCPAIDPISKADAFYTEKFGGDKNQTVEVGGSEMYRPRDWVGFFGSDR
jgi:thymidine kinase